MPVFGLIHSPLVSPFTWSLVAAALRRQGTTVLVPDLRDDPSAGQLYWQQQAESAARQLAVAPSGERLILAAHSGAGPLLPAIRQVLGRPVAAYLFVDAGLPIPGQSRLETFGSAETAAQLREFLAGGGLFPAWTPADLAEIVPDAALRERLVAELRPRGLPYWDEPLPPGAGWPDAPVGYLLFTPTYQAMAGQARAAGWPTRDMPAGHFHMLVEPAGVAQALLALAVDCGVT